MTVSARPVAHDPLATAVVAALGSDPDALAVLRDLLKPEDPAAAEPTPPAYTVASLAAALAITPKVIRGAIGRGELAAVKRAGRWLIPADAVEAWTRPVKSRRFERASRQKRDAPLAEAFQHLGRGAGAA